MMRALFLAVLAGPVFATTPTSCPLILAPEAITVRAPAGWYGSVPTFLRLTGAGVLRGHPDAKGYLVPDKIQSSKGRDSTTFVFDAGEEKWLWCTYGVGAPQLAMRLSDGATECTVLSKRDKQGSILETAATCR